MSKLGEYITNEYGVLKQIFSYLPSKSLASASQVCREWNRVATRLLAIYNRPISYYRESGKEWPPFQDQLQPKLILHFTSSYGSKHLGTDFYPMISKKYSLDNVSVYNIRNSYLIGSEFVDDKLKIKPRLGKNCEASLILCDMPGVTIKNFFIHSENDYENLGDAVKEKLDSQDIKCLIVIAGGSEECIYNAHAIILQFNEYNRTRLAHTVGGVAHKTLRFSPFNRGPVFSHSCLCITFHGENVSSSAAVHHLHESLDDFMKRFAARVGPLPKGGIRIGFLFSCVNRLNLMGEAEIEKFSSYFPNVPLYGIWSYGEITAFDKHADQNQDRDNRRNKVLDEWLVSECSSYVILTLKRESI